MLQRLKQIYDNLPRRSSTGLIILAVVVILGVSLLSLAFEVVPPGSVGVQTYFGAVQDLSLIHI